MGILFTLLFLIAITSLPAYIIGKLISLIKIKPSVLIFISILGFIFLFYFLLTTDIETDLLSSEQNDLVSLIIYGIFVFIINEINYISFKSKNDKK